MNNHEFENLNGMTRYCKEAGDKFGEYFNGLIGNKEDYSENIRGNLIMAIDAMKQITRSSKNRLEELTQTQLDKTNGEENK